jgi:hypothetical protein
MPECYCDAVETWTCSVGPVSDDLADVYGTLKQILAEHGPLAEEELLGLVRDAGVDLGEDPGDTLSFVLADNPALIVELIDGRWVWLPALLRGRIFTHRLDEVEARCDVLRFGTDLGPALTLVEDSAYQTLTDGTPLGEANQFFNSEVLAERGATPADIGPNGALLLPVGRFAAMGVGAGDLIGLRIGDEGYELVEVGQPEPGGEGELLAGFFDAETDQPEIVDNILWMLCVRNHSAFRTAGLPLQELIEASGVAADGDWIAPAGFDVLAWRTNNDLELIKGNYQLDSDQALAVLLTLGLYRQVCALLDSIRAAADAGDEVDLSTVTSAVSARVQDADGMRGRTALEQLADPAVAIAVLAETHSENEEAAIGLGIFAEVVEQLAPRAARPALRWLRAKAFERLGDIAQAEAALLAAESLDPAWPLTLMSLARYASDRGDAEGGLGLLRRAGAAADHELVAVLERFRPAPRSDIGRNDRCWCGSGRKYKACHLNNEQLPLEQRAVWLYHKAGGNLLEGEFGALLFEAAQVRSAEWDTPDALGRALQDELAIDVVLFEGGAFAEFIETRGALLPEDERALAEEWLGVRRSIHEVLNVQPGQGITVRDLRSGEVHEVQAPAASSHAVVGELYCARVVPVGPDGQVKRIFGCFAPVSPADRDDFIEFLAAEPDPLTLVAALSS